MMTESTQRQMLDFVRDANIKRLTGLLARTVDEQERGRLRRLLGEEMAKQADHSLATAETPSG